MVSLGIGEGEQALVVAGEVEESPRGRVRRIAPRRTGPLDSRAATGRRWSGCPSATRPWSGHRPAAGSAASESRARCPPPGGRSGGRAGGASAWTQRPRARTHSVSIPRCTRWHGPSPGRLETAGHRARPVDQPRKGSAGVDSPSTPGAPGPARSDRLRSGFHWVTRQRGSGRTRPAQPPRARRRQCLASRPGV